MARVRECLVQELPQVLPPFTTISSRFTRFLSNYWQCRQLGHFLGPSANSVIVRASNLRPSRRSLGYIGIPNRHDSLATHIRFARVRFYLRHRRSRARMSSTRTTRADFCNHQQHVLCAHSTATTDSVTVDGSDPILLCVGGQFN